MANDKLAGAEQPWKEQGAGEEVSLREAFASRPKKELSLFMCVLKTKLCSVQLNTYVAQMLL